MFNAARRGPASIARLVQLSSSVPKCALSPCPWSRYPLERGSSPVIAVRSLSSAIRYQQRASPRAIEEEIQEEVNAPEPPSESAIREATQHGPVTRFQGLSDRKMVCDTLVKTITRDMGLETMTQVQSMTINETLKGIDVYVSFYKNSSLH